jgi:hypothetical protein
VEFFEMCDKYGLTVTMNRQPKGPITVSFCSVYEKTRVINKPLSGSGESMDLAIQDFKVKLAGKKLYKYINGKKTFYAPKRWSKPCLQK